MLPQAYCIRAFSLIIIFTYVYARLCVLYVAFAHVKHVRHTWCLQDILLMVGPYGDWIKHNLESKTVLVSECDGVRLISAELHELLSRVPDSLTDIFKIGSTAPGQHLCTLTSTVICSMNKQNIMLIKSHVPMMQH